VTTNFSGKGKSLQITINKAFVVFTMQENKKKKYYFILDTNRKNKKGNGNVQKVRKPRHCNGSAPPDLQSGGF